MLQRSNTPSLALLPEGSNDYWLVRRWKLRCFTWRNLRYLPAGLRSMPNKLPARLHIFRVMQFNLLRTIPLLKSTTRLQWSYSRYKDLLKLNRRHSRHNQLQYFLLQQWRPASDLMRKQFNLSPHHCLVQRNNPELQRRHTYPVQLLMH